MNTIRQVVDESGAIHVLSKKIGAGGQGEVWLAEGGRRIVKLLNHGSDAERLRHQFTLVRRLDLTNLHVAKPIAVLKPPHVGYVADFLGDMVPIKVLMKAPPSDLLRWYIDTGGLRRRLKLLAHAGEALMGLHARGVIYADVSDNNVFVSEPITALESWLIDLDNLSHKSDPRRALYTRGYGAPEVVQGRAGCTSLSDAWAFAVLVWQTLTLSHPFVGDIVDNGEPEEEDNAFAGRLPWVRHSTQDQNFCSSGIQPELVMGGPPKDPKILKIRSESLLLHLARKTFEHGLNNIKARPGVASWVDALHEAADKTIVCSSCKGSFYVSETECPWCGEPCPTIIPIQIVRWQPKDENLSPECGQIVNTVLPMKLPLTNEGVVLTRRVTQGLTGVAGREGHVEIMPVDRGMRIRTLTSLAAWVAPADQTHGKLHDVSSKGRIIPGKGWMIFFEESNKTQRVALIGANA